MRLLLAQLINILYYAVLVLVLARVILSWVRVGSYELRDTVFRLSEPLLAPIRRLLPATAGIDFSPIILLLGVDLLRRLLIGLLL